MDSRSLKPLLEAQTNVHRDYVFSGLKKWRLVYDGRYKLINNWQKDYLLFDTETDPNELNDLSLNPKYQDHLNRLNQQLEKHKLHRLPASLTFSYAIETNTPNPISFVFWVVALV